MTRVTAPGLPPSPRLMFDTRTRRAKVSVRHPTWQSEMKAAQATFLIVLAARVALGWNLWHRMPIEDLTGRIVATLMIYFVTAPIVSIFLRATLQGFLARQVFPKRTTLWATPTAIAFRSHLYPRPVVIWREWKGVPVRPSFMMYPNEPLDRYRKSLSVEQRSKKSYLNNASMLVMVIATAQRSTTDAYGGKNGTARAIPITDIDALAVSRFTMVFSMALQMTAPQPDTGPTPAQSGIDIDAI